MSDSFQRDFSLRSQLQAMIQRYQFITLSSKVLQLVVFLGTTVIFFCVLDFFLPLPIEGRLGLSGCLYICLAGMVSWILIRPFLTKMNHERMAWMLEDKCQNFDESLVSALSFDQNKEQKVSEEMKEKVVDDAEATLHQYHPLVIFRISKNWMLFAGLASVVYVGLYIGFLPHSSLLLKRVLLPSEIDARPGSFVLDILFPDEGEYIEGNSVTFRVRASGRQPDQVNLKIRQNSIRTVELNWNEETQVFESTLNGLVGDLNYRFESEDVITTEKHLKYLPRPKLEEFDLKYEYPAYTGLGVKEVSSRSGDLQAVVGTKIKVKVTCTQRLSSHQLSWLDELKITEHPKPGKLTFNFEKMIEESGEYQLELINQKNIKSLEIPTFKINAIADKAPEVSWLAMEPEIYLTPKSTLDCKWIAEDDFKIVEQKIVLVQASKELKSISVPYNTRQKEISFSDLGLGDGSSLDLVLLVSDHLQTTRSEVIKLHIVDDEKVQFALPFVKNSNLALKELADLNLELNKVQNTIELIPELNETSSEFDRGERAHQLGVQKIRLQRLSEQMMTLQNIVEDLQTMAFFKKSEEGLSLENRYLEYLQVQEFNTLLEQPDLEQPLENLILSTSLSKNLLVALKNRAQQHHDRFELVRHQKLKQSLSGNTIHDLKQKYLEDLMFLNELKIPKDQQGLNAIYIKDRKWYTDPIKEGLPKGDKQFISPKVDYPNIASMGWNHHQVFTGLWYGFLKTKKEGTHKFFLNSDDGSRLYINGQRVVSNDGDHAMVEKNGQMYLKPGFQFIEIHYYNSSSEAGLQWKWQPPNEGKTMVPSWALKTMLSESEKKQFWSSSLASLIDRRLNNDNSINQAIQAIREQLPRDQLDLNMALAQLEKGDESHWQKVERVQEMLESLAGQTNDEELSETHEVAAELLAEIIEEKDRDRLEEFNEVINEAKREEEDGQEFLAKETKAELAALVKDELDLLNDALAQLSPDLLNDQSPEETSKSLDEALQKLNEAKEELQNSIMEDLQSEPSKEPIKGDVAVLKSLEKAQADQSQSMESDQKRAEQLQKALEQAKSLAEQNEAMKKNQLSMQEQDALQESIDEVLEQLATAEEREQLNKRDQLQSLQSKASSMQEKSEQLQKKQQKEEAKSLADQAERTKQEVNALAQSEPDSLNPAHKDPNHKLNLDQLSHQIHNLKSQLNQAEEHQLKRKGAQQQASIQRAKAQEMLNEIDKDSLDHQQDQEYEKAEKSLTQPLNHTRDALNRLADKMRNDKQLNHALKDLAKDMQTAVDEEHKINHYQHVEEDKVKQLNNQAKQLNSELAKSNLPEAQAMQKALESSQAAAEAGQYEDARKSLEALEKDALALANKMTPDYIDENFAAFKAMEHLNDAESKLKGDSKSPVQEARKLTEAKDYDKASKTLENLLAQKNDDLERLNKVKDLASKQHEQKHLLDSAEREVKHGRMQHASMKLAATDHDDLAKEALAIEQDTQDLIREMEERKAKSSDKDLRKDLQDAINDGRQGKFKDMHRELTRSKEDVDDLLEKSEDLYKRHEQLSKAIDRALDSNKNAISEAKAEFKKELNDEKSKLRSELNKEKDQKKRKEIQEDLHQVEQEYRLSQSHDLNGYKHHLMHQLKGYEDAKQAQDALKLAEALKQNSQPIEAEALSQEEQMQLKDVGQAIAKAQEPLKQGKANQQSSESFEQASNALAEMVAQYDQQQLAQLQSQKDQQAQAAMASGTAQQEPSNEPGESGGQYQFEPDDQKTAFNSSNWDDLQGALKEQGGQGAENIYDDYFNQANHRYLQKIMKASREW